MQQTHATVGVVLLVAIALFTAVAAVLSRASGARPWLEKLRVAVVSLLVVQALLGALIYSQGERPSEGLHLLYGAFALGAIPAVSAFAAEAPPRSRAGALAIGGLFTLVLIWRLFVTGGSGS